MARGSVRVTRRRRRSPSGARVFTEGNVVVRRSGGARSRVDLVARGGAEGVLHDLVGDRESTRPAVRGGGEDGAEDPALAIDQRPPGVAAADRAAQGRDPPWARAAPGCARAGRVAGL